MGCLFCRLREYPGLCPKPDPDNAGVGISKKIGMKILIVSPFSHFSKIKNNDLGIFNQSYRSSNCRHQLWRGAGFAGEKKQYSQLFIWYCINFTQYLGALPNAIVRRYFTEYVLSGYEYLRMALLAIR